MIVYDDSLIRYSISGVCYTRSLIFVVRNCLGLMALPRAKCSQFDAPNGIFHGGFVH